MGSATDGCVRIAFDEERKPVTTFFGTTRENKIQSDVVYDIFEDSHSNTWILTQKGLSNYNRTTNATTSVSNNRKFVKALEIKNQVFFIADKGEIYSYNAQRKSLEFSCKLPIGSSANKSTIFNNKLLITTFGQGVYIVDPFKKQVINTDFLLNEHIGGNANIQIDNNQNIWIYNLTGKVWLFSPHKSKITKLDLIPASILQLIDEERYQFYADKGRF